MVNNSFQFIPPFKFNSLRMKKSIFIITTVLSLIQISCKSSQPFSDSSDMNKTLYKSCLNIIYLNPKYQFSDISITNGELNKINDTSYSVVIDTSYTTKLVFKHQSKILKEINFRVKSMPEPELLFWSKANIDLNNITLNEFKEVRSISTVLKDFTVDCIFNMIHLTVIRIRDGEEKIIEFENPTNIDLDRIKFSAQKNDIYIFKNIKIKIKQTNRIIDGKEITIYLK